MACQIVAPAVLNPSEKSLLRSEEEVGLAPEPFWTVWRKEIYVTTQPMLAELID